MSKKNKKSSEAEAGQEQAAPLTAPSDSSLAALSRAFAKVMGKSGRDRDRPTGAEAPGEEAPGDDALRQVDADAAATAAGEAEDEGAPPSVQMIVEGAIFLGHPDNAPLSSRQIAALVRGVSPQEVDQIVCELNAAYDEEGCAYRIESLGPGYRLQLRPEYAPLRDKFYGRVRQARLSQAAIDVLAIVAYHQPVDRQEVERLRGRSSGGVLSQLVRRELLRIERSGEKPRQPSYHTTDRFLHLFGLESLEELPQSHEFDRAGG